MDGRSDESKQGANQEWVEIVRARSAMEAHAIRILLEEHGFDVRIDGEALLGALGGLPVGWETAPRVLVPADEAAGAVELIETIKRQQTES